MAGEQRRRRLRALLDCAGVPIGTLPSIERAFVHESAAKEQQIESNERQEFLGDAILGMVVADWLYAAYEGEKEGALAKRKAAIVSDTAIAATAKRLGFSDLIELGAGERAHGGAERPSILADAFEAFVASLYLEHGIDAARRFIESQHIACIDHETAAQGDAKTQLQELTQARFACMPVYQERGEGPAHARRFTSAVEINGETLGTGIGPSKKIAQQSAAMQALLTLQARDATQTH